MAILFQKVYKSGIAHRTPKTSRTHAHPAHFSEWISHANAHAHVRPHIARVRAHAPSQLIPWLYVPKIMCPGLYDIAIPRACMTDPREAYVFAEAAIFLAEPFKNFAFTTSFLS